MSEIASRGQLRLSYLRVAVVTVPLILLLGFASSLLAPAGSENRWYQALAKPDFTPPDQVFPIAWTILYILLGLALAHIVNARGARGRQPAIALFVIQLILNLAWSPLFFGAHQIGLALLVIIAIFVVALAATLLFWPIRRVAALLMLPYLAWIAFAGVLTQRIDAMNPGAETLVPPAERTKIML